MGNTLAKIHPMCGTVVPSTIQAIATTKQRNHKNRVKQRVETLVTAYSPVQDSLHTARGGSFDNERKRRGSLFYSTTSDQDTDRYDAEEMIKALHTYGKHNIRYSC